MNTSIIPVMMLGLSLPCAAVPELRQEYSAKHMETATRLAGQQDELQADTSDLIMGETNEEVVELLKKCRHAMNDAVDLLEVYDTGGKTLAAQSDVIELIYLAAKKKMHGSKPGAMALMDMLRQLLGMDESSMEQGEQEGKENGEGKGQGDGSSKDGKGNNPGKGADGKSNMQSTQEKGVSNPDMAAESRSVPKSTGMSPDDMPSEFRKALDAYNKTLQK